MYKEPALPLQIWKDRISLALENIQGPCGSYSHSNTTVKKIEKQVIRHKEPFTTLQHKESNVPCAYKEVTLIYFISHGVTF